eukprot:5479751-Prymnesium_polylepis.2
MISIISRRNSRRCQHTASALASANLERKPSNDDSLRGELARDDVSRLLLVNNDVPLRTRAHGGSGSRGRVNGGTGHGVPRTATESGPAHSGACIQAGLSLRRGETYGKEQVGRNESAFRHRLCHLVKLDRGREGVAVCDLWQFSRAIPAVDFNMTTSCCVRMGSPESALFTRNGMRAVQITLQQLAAIRVGRAEARELVADDVCPHTGI